MLLSIAYFPPISWFAAAVSGFVLSKGRAASFDVCLEACEHYQKQSYRNRCRYYSSMGADTLTVPIIKGGCEPPIREALVDYSVPWLLHSERAIVSAYRSSAFFEYYKDELFGLLERRPDTLWELDLSIILFFMEKIGLPARINFTEEYLPMDSYPAGCDLRGVIHPKHEDYILTRLGLEKPYFQVFALKHGFIPNLSIMDLLFNEGPNSISYLMGEKGVV